MKLLIALMLLSGVAYGQTTYYIRADTTKLQKIGGSNELVLLNDTRDTLGALVNIGGGKTEFARFRVSGDTLFLGRDTILGISGTTPTLQQVITAGAVLTGNNTISGSPTNDHTLTISGMGLDVSNTVTDEYPIPISLLVRYTNSGSPATLHRSYIELRPDSLIFSQQIGGNFFFDGISFVSAGDPADMMPMVISPSNGLARYLSPGTAGQVLAMDATATFVEWVAASGGMTNPMTTTGDIIYSSSGSTPARRGIGATNDVLTVIGGVPVWQAPAGGAVSISALTAAAGTNTINNAALQQEWQWNTLATTSGLKLSSTSTAAASSGQILMSVLLSGANSNASETTTAALFANIHTGTTPTNIGVKSSAISGGINIAGWFIATGGTSNIAVQVLGDIVPQTNDLAVLGSATKQFSDLFLAEGAVINFDNGDATITQTGNIVDLAGAALRVDAFPTISTGTSTRIPYFTTAGLLTDNSGLTIDFSSVNALSLAGSNAARFSFVMQNTNSTGNASYYFQNNVGGFGAYGGLGTTGSAYTGLSIMGLGSNMTFLLADGASNTALGITTLTSIPVVLGANNTERMRIIGAGQIGIGVTGPTAALHLKAGTASASTAPLKFNSGTLNTTAEAGAVEFLTDKWYATITTGAARKEITLNESALTDGFIPIATTNGRLMDGPKYDEATTFTPTLGNTTNVSASTAYATYYTRTGTTYEVWGEVDIDATVVLTPSELTMTLPISSDIVNTYDLAGGAWFSDNTAVQVQGSVAGNLARFLFTPQSATNNKYSFRFTFKYFAP